MKHPKTCDRCKALYQSQWDFTCLLGYDIAVKTKGKFHGCDVKIVYPRHGRCPKPVTYEEFVRARNAESENDE